MISHSGVAAADGDDDDDNNDDGVFTSKSPLPATSKRMLESAAVNIWDTTTMPFMQNAKNSSGRDVLGMETGFWPWNSAITRVLAFTVSTNSLRFCFLSMVLTKMLCF